MREQVRVYRRINETNLPALTILIGVKFRDILYSLSRDILYKFSSSVRGLQPVFDRGRTLAGEIEFAHQGTAVVHQDPFSDLLQPHPFSAQSCADLPVPLLEPQLAGAVDFSYS